MVKYYYQDHKPVGLLWESGEKDDASIVLATIGAVVVATILVGFIIKKKTGR